MKGHHTNTWIGIQQMFCCSSIVSGARQDLFPQFFESFSWQHCEFIFVSRISEPRFMCVFDMFRLDIDRACA